MQVSVFWFRRDLRLVDNTALNHALSSGKPVLPVFIFDDVILEDLPRNDARVNFILQNLMEIDGSLKKFGSSILCKKGNPIKVWNELISEYQITDVFVNKDYEPYALNRDHEIKALLSAKGILFHAYKDQVVFEENEILKPDGKPYTVFTPYKNKWLQNLDHSSLISRLSPKFENFLKIKFPQPSLNQFGFEANKIKVKAFHIPLHSEYEKGRNFPALNATSGLSPHLRFGTVSIRSIIDRLKPLDHTFLNELIWREFFMQILFHFPHVAKGNFKSKYDGIRWRNNEPEFERWCNGTTGYPLVDAGMRELNETGYMHNRVRMVTASFLCKHLLIDWRWGEAYFAQKLLDFELASNNGNWQWASGTGCDAAPYFRIFNPSEQLKKFDPEKQYTNRFIPELNSSSYPKPIVEHKFARDRALQAYKAANK
jgi:deoxyribodipyrimidine photo-lyase